MNMCSLCERGLVSRNRPSQMILLFNGDILDRNTKDPISYIDIKSEELRGILREVLKDVHGISLMVEKPTVRPSSYQRQIPSD
jgi:hypothetical protein